MKVNTLFKDFIESERVGGFILIVCAIISLVLANSPIGERYLDVWHIEIGNYPIEFWINDGLMTLFFLLVGLEIEREFYIGEFSNIRKAILPAAAAIGGMAVPALIHFLFNAGTATQNGTGIPTATDIAFSLGVLSLLGNKVPLSLKIFLTTLAIIDDLGAIIIISLFYSNEFSLNYFIVAMVLFAVMFLLNRLRVYNISIYFLLGFTMWYFILQSGIHATITGVLLAFVIPFGDGHEKSPSYKLQQDLHHLVAFIILPLFALANTGIIIPDDWLQNLSSANSLGIILGLVLGKPLGIVLFSIAAIATGLCVIPKDVKPIHLVGVGALAGIGFTMSIFITLLAFKEESYIINSKIAVFVASLVSGVIGYIVLKYNGKTKGPPVEAISENIVMPTVN